ncbi:hypothetical protein GDO78_019549 [Eleutherodactylus coqui]|uniref:Uncharacterized protein n=1 Tax=Eleutherodactylus coqui TaxID=57060 RepID=A0A8J6BJC3_ELECQ|nr:hypothetical protein GDO78_019549 [Eleutherodactylus coqui]
MRSCHRVHVVSYPYVRMIFNISIFFSTLYTIPRQQDTWRQSASEPKLQPRLALHFFFFIKTSDVIRAMAWY